MSFINKFKEVIEACCGKLDNLKIDIHKQNSRISNLQQQIESIKENQNNLTVLLEEILYNVSQSNETNKIKVNHQSTSHHHDFENLVQNKSPFDVN